MRTIHFCAVLTALAFAGGLTAGLIDAHFPEKSEKVVAEEFEAGLGAFLKARLQEPQKPRIYVEDKRGLRQLELIKVDGEDSTWQELARTGWYEEKVRYAREPFGETYTYETAEIAPREIAGWFIARHRNAEEMIACAVWLAIKGELMLANGELADLASEKEDLKPDIEAWLCEKYDWEKPDGGLTAVATQDLDRHEHVVVFLAGEDLEDYRDELEDKADDEFDRLEDMQGGDLRGEPGRRRNSPTIRLDQLQDRTRRYREAFAETEFYQKKRTREELDELEAVLKADIEFIETEKFKAERLGIEGDWVAAAKAYDVLYRTDPWNPEVVQMTAEAWSRAAGISDAGRKAEEPAAARKAALLYERMSEIFEAALAFHNHAGINWLAAGDKRKSVAHHEIVIERTDDRTDLTENDIKNRKYAEDQLARID